MAKCRAILNSTRKFNCSVWARTGNSTNRTNFLLAQTSPAKSTNMNKTKPQTAWQQFVLETPNNEDWCIRCSLVANKNIAICKTCTVGDSSESKRVSADSLKIVQEGRLVKAFERNGQCVVCQANSAMTLDWCLPCEIVSTQLSRVNQRMI